MVVLVTGCRSGFGQLIAERLASAGHCVYASCRDVATAPASLGAAGCHVLGLDATVAAEREAAVARILAEQGRLDVLVNNAGVALGGPLELVDEDELRAVFEVNVFGVWALTKAALPALRASKGLVVQVSSMSGRMGLPGLGVYSGSKFALEGMSESWSRELRPLGVRMVLLEPGAYRTDIWGRNRGVSRNVDAAHPVYGPLITHMDGLMARIVGRSARDPEEVALRVLGLLGEARPPLRIPMGKDARLRALAVRLMPGRMVEAVLARLVLPKG